MVAGPGIAPGLGDYEPPVQLYTTPRHESYITHYNSLTGGWQSVLRRWGRSGLMKRLNQLGRQIHDNAGYHLDKKSDGKIGGDIKMEHSHRSLINSWKYLRIFHDATGYHLDNPQHDNKKHRHAMQFAAVIRESADIHIRIVTKNFRAVLTRYGILVSTSE